MPYLLTRRALLLAPGSLWGQDFEGVCGRLMREHQAPGVQAVSIENGAIVHRVALGLAEVGSQRKMSMKTPFEAASLSKPVFAALVMRLIEGKKFGLETELGEVLQGGDYPTEERFRRIRVRQILAHTSGIQPEPLKGLAVRVGFEPGTKFQYSPHGFDYLQRLVEIATRKTVRELVREFVLDSIGMLNSDFDWTADFESKRAVGYDKRGQAGRTINERVWRMSSSDRVKLREQYPLMNFPNAASSLTTTAEDYAKFVIELTGPKWRGMLAKQVSAGKEVDWGLGIGLLKSKAQGEGFWHWGDWGFMQHFAVGFPGSRTGFVGLSNGVGGQRVFLGLTQLLWRERLAAFPWIGM